MSTEPNIPLLRKAVEWVEAQAALPEIDREWMQSDWLATPHDRARWNFELHGQVAEIVAAHCGAAYCVAGWVAQGVDPRYATASEVDGIHAADVAAGALGLDARPGARTLRREQHRRRHPPHRRGDRGERL